MSSFGWLDYSEHDRKRALDVVSLFAEKSTVDELGLGTIRDRIAELLSPGTNTIQTRAKYFLLIPWIYVGLEKKRIGSHEIAERARKEELQLVDALVKGGEREGVIGRITRRFARQCAWRTRHGSNPVGFGGTLLTRRGTE